MNCYRCLVEMKCNHQLACALCQRCGAGVCARHLVQLTVTPIVGMASGGHPRQSLICQDCHQLAFTPPQRPQSQDRGMVSKEREQKTPVLWKMWYRVRGQRQVELLNPEDVVAAAELHLKRQRNL